MGMRPLWIAASVALVSAPALASDVVKLHGGGVIRGLVVDHRSNDDSIKFRTERGEIPILQSAIERIERDSDLDARYWLAREYYDETPAGYYELALWCHANRLDDARDEHLHDVLRIDPDHADARKQLGYLRRGKEWVLV